MRNQSRANGIHPYILPFFRIVLISPQSVMKAVRLKQCFGRSELAATGVSRMKSSVQVCDLLRWGRKTDEYDPA